MSDSKGNESPPGGINALYDLITLAPVRYALFGNTEVWCPECGQVWDGHYQHEYFNYCYTCGSEVCKHE